MKYISSDNVSKKGGANLEIPTALPPHYLIVYLLPTIPPRAKDLSS
jgi:hypothetical protein